MQISRGFTLLEMVVVLVMMGIVTSLALPGLQKMYDSMSSSLERNELNAVLNNLALDVRAEARAINFNSYPEGSHELPQRFLKRIEPLNVSLTMQEPLSITSTGFCPNAGVVRVTKGTKDYFLRLRSPDCHVVME